MEKKEISKKIKEKALELGFYDCGIVEAGNLLEEEIHFKIWLDNNYNADMEFLEKNTDKRFKPEKLVENTKSIICVLYNYYPDKKQKSSKYIISKYALSKDYHKVIKTKLRRLYEYINNEIVTVNGRFFVDSAPVLEKAIARRAGLGWIGKNSLLLNKNGSFFFIGEIFVDIELEYDKTLNYNYCGTCTKCIDACPTGAIYDDYKIDANKCIAYHTIENKKEIPIDLKNKFSKRIYGCDICQDICPWNNKIIPNVQAIDDIIRLTDDDFENITETEFNKIFSETSIKRIKFERFKRNINFVKLI